MLLPDPPRIDRTYTVEQANAALPLIEPIVRDVMRMERRVRHLRFRLKFIRRGGEELLNMFANEIHGLENELHQAEDELARNHDELLELGIEPEGPAMGLVDFPHEQLGQTVFLCWQYGESAVEFWHTLTGGFPNRLPVARPIGQESFELATSKK